MVELWKLHIMNYFATIKNELEPYSDTFQNFHEVLLGEKEAEK